MSYTWPVIFTLAALIVIPWAMHVGLNAPRKCRHRR